MIDVEKEIFGIVSKAVRAKYSKIFMTGEYVSSPPSFPCVYLLEMDNQIYQNTRTNECIENHAQLIYEVNVFSNLKTGKKSQCRDIMSLIDTELERLGFTRTMMNPVPNEGNATIYRMVARYRAVVSKDNVIYRR